MEEQNLNQEQKDTSTQEPPKEEMPNEIIIRMWPKTPMVYPMALMALICCLVGLYFGTTPYINKMTKMVNAETVQEASSGESQESANSSEEASSGEDEEQEGEAANQEEQSEEEGTTAGSTTVSQDYESVVKNLVSARTVDKVLGVLFLIVFAFSMFTLCIDIEVRWALISFSLIIIVLLVIYITNEKYEYLPNFISRLATLTPMASPIFYFSIAFIWLILMIISMLSVRFHYVIVESNEVTVIGGLLERQQRFPTTRMKYSKDIQDVFEYYLPFVRSGRLIFYFPEQNETVVIDNVIQIDKVISHLNHISGMIQVSGYDR